MAFLLGLTVVVAFFVVLMEMTFSIESESLPTDEEVAETFMELLPAVEEKEELMTTVSSPKQEVSQDRIEISDATPTEWKELVQQQIAAAATLQSHADSQAEELQQVLSEDTPIDLKTLETLPRYPGGMTALVKYLTDNLTYPQLALKHRKQGMVEVQFVINLDGTISDPIVLNPLYPSLDREALRVISSMPRWEAPGSYQGRPCRTLFVIPVVFQI